MYMYEIQEKIKNGDYDNKGPYPSKLPAPIDGEPSLTKEDLRRMRENWRGKGYILRTMLSQDCFTWAKDEIKNLTPDKFDILWETAWEKGHDEGYHRVTVELEELVDLIKKFID